jgi:chromosome partitioning protein
MMDFESARYFLKLTKEVLGAVRQSFNVIKKFEFLRVLITKFQPGVQVQQKLANWQRGIFDEFCLSEPMLLSNAVQNLGPTLQTLYEAGPGYRGSREALKRALESVNAVNGLIEGEVVSVLKRWATSDNIATASPTPAIPAERAA